MTMHHNEITSSTIRNEKRVRQKTHTGKDVETLETLYIAGRSVKWYGTLGNNLKLSKRLGTWPVIWLLGVHLKWMERPTQWMLIIHQSSKVETTQLPIKWWLVHLYRDRPMQWKTTCAHVDGEWRRLITERSQSQKVIYYVIPFAWMAWKRKMHMRYKVDL